MKTAQLTALRELRIAECETPRLERPDDVLVRIDRVGVCGSDVHYYTRGRIGDQVVDYPAGVGHECAGTVVEIGPEAETVSAGDRVAVDPAIVCEDCDQCRAGRWNTCRNLLFMGCPGEAPGALAEYCVMPARNCVRLPKGVSLDEAALAEPLSIGLYAATLGEVHPAARVAVLGAGPIGLSVLISAKAIAPSTVYVTDLLDARLKVAGQCGADWTGNPRREDVVEAIRQQEPWGLDLVFECSGEPACIDQAMQLLTPGGTLVLVGIPHSQKVDLDFHVMRRRELFLKNVRRQKGCLAPAIRLLDEGRFDSSLLLTHRFGLEEVQQAFELVADYRDGVVKAIIDVSAAG
jgi:L-iditol 2-dehydrogenase